MTNNKRIAVFLSSHEQLPESYVQAAEAVGKWLGQHQHTLVYGGARKGLMEVLAQSARANGARIFGVVPQILTEKRLVSDTLDVTFHCADLNDRKAIMIRESEVFLALPGGIGTLDEIFTVLAANTIGYLQKPVIFYNVDGCWNQALATLNDLLQKQLINVTALEWVHEVNNIDALEAICEKL